MSAFLALSVDATTVQQARSGDRSAQERLYRACAPAVYTLIRRIVGRPAVAEELLQDVFVDVLQRLQGYDGRGSFAGWLRSVAVNKALMYVRSPWHRSLAWLPVAAVDRAGDEQFDGNSFSAALDNRNLPLECALQSLPPISRSVVWLFDVEGYSHEEIAALFGKSVSFSKSQLSRAHRALRLALQPPAENSACVPPTGLVIK